MQTNHTLVDSTIQNLQLDYYKANPRKETAIKLAVEYPQMTVQERAKRVGVHRSTLWRWTRETIFQQDYIRLTENRNNRLRRTKAIA